MHKITTFFAENRFFFKRFVTVLLLLISFSYLVFIFREKQEILRFSSVFEKLFAPGNIAISLLLAAFNWYLRILKWKITVSRIEPVSLKQSFYQQLSAFSWSFFTPLNAGEYIHKPLFFQQKNKVFKAVGLEQFSQMFITVAAGSIALAFKFHFNYKLTGIVLFILIILYILLSTYYRQILLLSFLRYIVFAGFMSWLLYLILPVGLMKIITFVPLYYLIISFLPLVSWFDLPVRSSLAIWVFSASHSGPEIVSVIAWLWLFNTLIPALTGQWLVLYRLQKAWAHA